MAIGGTALAQGLMSGLGQAGQRYFADQRRMKMDDRKLEKTFTNFKKQADYSAALQLEKEKQMTTHRADIAETARETDYTYAQKEADYRAGAQLGKEKKVASYKSGLADITAKGSQLEAWERAAKMGVQDLVYAGAMKAAQGFAPSDRPQFIRDYMKRNAGITKAQAINNMGLTLPDYSKYADNPDFKDAIPVARIAGAQEMPDADSIFEYTPPETTEGEPELEPQWKVEQDSRRVAYKERITSNSDLTQMGITDVDKVLLNQIDTELQFGKQDPVYVDSTTSIEVDRVSDTVLRGLSSGKYTVLDGTLMPINKAQNIMALEQEAAQPPQPMETPMEPQAPMEPQGELPTTSAEQVRLGKEEKVKTERYRTEAKEIGTKLANENVVGVMDAIEVADTDLKALSPEALSYLYSALNETEGNVRKAVDAYRKSKDPAAREASMALQSLMGVLNVELKDRSGAAVTESEEQRFYAELGRASTVGSLEETLKGLANLRGQKLSKAEGYMQGREQGTIDAFLATSPKFQKYFEEHETYGTEEGKERATTRTEIKTQAEDLLAQGASMAEVQEYLGEVYGEDAQRLGLELP